MSLPPEERGRRRQRGTVGGTPPAQMSHALGSRGARWRRDGERALETERRRHVPAGPLAGEDPGNESQPAGAATLLKISGDLVPQVP